MPEFDLLVKTEQGAATPYVQCRGAYTTCINEGESDENITITMLLHDMGKPDFKTMDETGQAHFKNMQLVVSILPKKF